MNPHPKPGHPDGQDFFSKAQGVVNANADGTRMPVAETLGGRVFEVDIATGDILWTYTEFGDLKPYLDRFGGEPGETGSVARLQTQGADYIGRDAFDRIFGSAPALAKDCHALSHHIC